MFFWTFDLIEKRFADFFLVHWNTKKIKFSKNIKKSRYRRVAQKMYNFAPGPADHTFLTGPVYIFSIYLSIYLFFHVYTNSTGCPKDPKSMLWMHPMQPYIKSYIFSFINSSMHKPMLYIYMWIHHAHTIYISRHKRLYILCNKTMQLSMMHTCI